MKKLIIVLITLIPILTIAQTGSITGNVFYKYNDFVGNRPDAGAEVSLFKKDLPSFKKEIVVDMQGNFSIMNLDSGTYLLLIKSKNTNEDPYMSFATLRVYSSAIASIFPDFKAPFQTPEADSINKENQELMQYLISSKAKAKKISELKNDIVHRVFKFYSTLPILPKSRLNISLPTEKIKIKQLTVTDKEEKVIVDFDITHH